MNTPRASIRSLRGMYERTKRLAGQIRSKCLGIKTPTFSCSNQKPNDVECLKLVWENIVPVWALPPLLEKFRRFDSLEATEVTSRTEVTFTLRKSKTEIAFFFFFNLTLGHTRKVLAHRGTRGGGLTKPPLSF